MPYSVWSSKNVYLPRIPRRILKRGRTILILESNVPPHSSRSRLSPMIHHTARTKDNTKQYNDYNHKGNNAQKNLDNE